MKSILFCSFLIAFFSFSCKPKPIDNLKDIARQAEENKVFRVSREKLASETQRVSDSVLTLVLSMRQEAFMGKSKPDTLCSFENYLPYLEFRKKFAGRAQLLTEPAEMKKLYAEMEELRKYRNELSEPAGQFPATFQTMNDTLLYVREIADGMTLCAAKPADNGFWVFRLPKQKFVEILTVKVKPKPAKGPNW